MSVDVAGLVRSARAAPFSVSPIDAVMGGEDWAWLRMRGPMGLGQQMYVLRRSQSRPEFRLPLSVAVAAGRPEAVVKLVRRGGTQSARDLRSQMAYLRRDGEIPLLRSERFFGVEIGPEDMDALVRKWGLDQEWPGSADRTTHFVVSFPRGTDLDAAARAGRAWAEEMFASGRFGDEWDYYTATHTDTDYPHTHVVVSRRGMVKGAWLKVSNREALTFDAMRAVQVEVAELEGIALQATPRLARGVLSRPVPDTELRRAREEGREPVAPEYTPEAAVYAAATVVGFARQFAADAAILRERSPALADRIEEAATVLADGLAVPGGGERGGMLDDEEVREMSDAITERRHELGAEFRALTSEIAEIDEPTLRAKFQRDFAALKSGVAQYLPNEPGIQSYTVRDADADYGGMPEEAGDARVRAIVEDGHAAVRALAREAGFVPEAAVERYAHGAPSKGLAADFEADELRERAGRFTGEDPGEARAALAAFRREVRAIYREAGARIAGLGRDDRSDRRDTRGDRDRDRDRGRDRDDDGFGF